MGRRKRIYSKYGQKIPFVKPRLDPQEPLPKDPLLVQADRIVMAKIKRDRKAERMAREMGRGDT